MAHAQHAGNFSTVQSVTGQFIVHNPGFVFPPPMPPDLLTNLSALELQPALLTVSAERIKQALWVELGATPDFRDKVHLYLRPAKSASDVVFINAERFKDSWRYKVDLPNSIEREKFVRAIVSVILLETANRKATDHSAEIPAWLTEALTDRLLTTRAKELMLPPPRSQPNGLQFTPVVNEVLLRDPLRDIRQTLKEHPPMTLDELSWPGDDEILGRDGGRFRRSASLFVTELQQMPNGRRALREMISELGACYNWQTAFFKSFSPQFTRQLDLEKWWALQVAHFTGREQGQLWSVAESLRQLDIALHVQVNARKSKADLPATESLLLQTVIRDWTALRQIPVLRTKVRELETVRLRTAQDVVGLVDEYRAALQEYLNRQSQPGIAFASRTAATSNARRLMQETIYALDALDRKRANFPLPQPPQPAVTKVVNPTETR